MREEGARVQVEKEVKHFRTLALKLNILVSKEFADRDNFRESPLCQESTKPQNQAASNSNDFTSVKSLA